MVLASNPIFPLDVQMKRLAWAKLDHLPFELATHIENMSFCKPRIEYYLEISKKIGAPPETCMMVGNDPVNDLIAAHAGMKTYLADDSNGAGRVRGIPVKFRNRFNSRISRIRTSRVPLQKCPWLFLHYAECSENDQLTFIKEND